MDNFNTSINVGAVAMGFRDKLANDFIINACESNETMVALIELFNEFGIYGERLMLLMNRMSAIVKTSEGFGLIEEEESDNN